MPKIDLLGTTSRVEAPFIIAEIGGKTFGLYNKANKNLIDSSGSYDGVITDYPNFMSSLSVTKINGSLNTYTLKMVYAIREGEDPNLIEKVLSKAKADRQIVFTYGDSSIPSFIYKKEKALITDVRQSLDISGTKISYTITAVSQALTLSSGTFNFPAVKAKPSDIIKQILYNKTYNLLSIFTGMFDEEKVLSKKLIASDDISVELEAKNNINILKYLNYLVSSMRSSSDSTSTVFKNNRYSLVIIDDISGEWQGTYFKIIKNSNSLNNVNSLDVYEIDVGYQGSNIVTSFNINSDEAYSILYDFAGETNKSEYIHRINDEGEMEMIYSPNISNSESLLKTTEAEKTWWTNVTQYPISATLTIKGLLKPAILMTYVKLNVLFYGRKHISSGYYIITKQTDAIDQSGFRTTLNLTRIKGEEI